jgi:chaperonin cofactor prefoldin
MERLFTLWIEQALNEEMNALNSQLDEIKKTMAELKVKLYGKFKNSINLEED